jgi:hypothetical protein
MDKLSISDIERMEKKCMDDQVRDEMEQPENDLVTIEGAPPEISEEESIAEEPKRRPTWLIIAAIGIAALVIGALLGYNLRPIVGPEARASKATAAAQAVAVQTQAAQNQEMMKVITGQVRHWEGDANAPVTIIEWSDFQ